MSTAPNLEGHHVFCPTPRANARGLGEDRDYPDADLGGTVGAPEYGAFVGALWHYMKRPQPKPKPWPKERISCRGVRVWPYTFPCPVIEVVDIYQRGITWD